MSGTIGGSKLGLDPDYASLLGGLNRDPRLLMAQKLMDVEKLPANNSTKSSFWANLLNQGARGALGGYMYGDLQADREKEATAQGKEAGAADTQLQDIMKRLGGGGAPVKDGSGGTAPAQPSSSPQPQAGPPPVPAPAGPNAKARSSAGASNGAPDLVQVSSPSGVKVTVARDAADAYTGFLAELEGSGYKLDQSQTGGYNKRNIAGTDTPSQHSFGHAVDINWRANPRGANGPSNLPPNVADIAAKHGLTWGGNWSGGTRDPMHFEFGRHADAGPPDAGSNLDALRAGMDAPKPRGIRLAENLLPGGTATDSPTPILPAGYRGSGGPFDLSSWSRRAGVPGTAAPAALPLLTPPAQPDAATTPPIAAAVPPRREPAVIPPPDAVPEPAVVPPPPEPAPDPAMIAPAGSGETGGQPTIPPQPPAEAAPAGSGETGGQPTVLPQEEPQLPVPPIPPALLARRLQQAAPAPPAGGGDNATEALNTASLAAARRGETFVPGAAPPGPQLAAPLMSWAGNLTDAGAPLLTPAGGPTGQQLAAPLLPPGAPGAASQQGGPVPLVTPASGPGDATGATTDTSAGGGPGKGAAPAPAQLPGGLPDQATVTEALTQAAQWKASPNPRVREKGIVLDTAATMAQRRLDQQTLQADRAADRAATREDRQLTHQDNLDLRRQTAADAAAGRAETAADRKERIRIENERLNLDRDQKPQNAQDLKLLEHGKRFVEGSNRTALEDIPGWSNGRFDFSKEPKGTADTAYKTLYPFIQDGTASKEQRADFETARSIIQDQGAKTVPDGQGGFVRETPQVPNLSPVYGALPPPPPPGPDQKADMGQNVAPGVRQYGPPGGRQQPAGEVDKMLAGVNSIRNTGDAMRALRENPSAVGPLTQIFPKLQQWFDPKGVATQAAVDDIGSELRHARSGGAVTEPEFRFLHNFVPEAGDPYEVAIQKVQRLHREYGNILQDRYNTYGPNGRYAEIPSVRDAIEEFRFPAVPKGRDNAQTEKMLDNGAAYTLPAGLGGGRAKWNAATRHFDRIQEGQ